MNFLNEFLGFELGVMMNPAVALLCGVGIFIVYYLTNRSIALSSSFSYTLILLPPVSAIVAFIVSNDIVLVAGMLGALSIVRFRHSVKESQNLVFVFWAVTAGIAAGLGFRKLTMLLCAVLGIAALAIHFISMRRSYATLAVKTSGSAEDIESVLKEHSLKYDVKYRNSNEVSDVLYELKRKNILAPVSSAACDKIMQLDGVSSVKFVEIR